jgi:hypothetical protein
LITASHTIVVTVFITATVTINIIRIRVIRLLEEYHRFFIVSSGNDDNVDDIDDVLIAAVGVVNTEFVLEMIVEPYC